MDRQVWLYSDFSLCLCWFFHENEYKLYCLLSLFVISSLSMIKKTLWIISPSFGPAKYYPKAIEKAVKNAEGLWYKVKFLPHALESNWYVSDTAENRAKDIMAAFTDSDIDVIMTMIWGNHANQTLKYIDWDVIRDNPKPFVGFSDISVLHMALYTQTGIKSFYGPAFITEFGEHPKPMEYTMKYFEEAVIQKKKIIEIISSSEWTDEFIDRWSQDFGVKEKTLEKNQWWKWMKQWRVEWEIIWGCIPSINHLLGTKYRPDVKNKVFFIDIPEGHSVDKGLPISDLDAYLCDLDNIWFFDDIQWLIVGRPYRYSKEDKDKLEQILSKYVEDKNYPVLLDADIGHTDPMITIQLGAKVVLDSEKNIFTILY